MRLSVRFLALSLLAVTVLVGELAAQAGPGGDTSSTVARPRKKPADPAEAPLEKIPSKLGRKKSDDAPPAEATFRSDAITVDVDVSVLTSQGQFIPNIPRGNFRITEDSVPQEVKTFGQGEAPMTICLLIEFSGLYQNYWTSSWYETLQATYGFVETLRPEDNVAVIAYDLKPEMLSDFTNNRQETLAALQRLRIPGFSESNLFDALADTVDRMKDIEGRKAVLVISSGVDTFSKLTFDKARKVIQQAGVPVYSFGIMQALRERADAYGYLSSIQRLDFLQADNQMKTFAKETGGQSYFPRFFGEFPGIYHSVSQALRNQYQLTYQSTNTARDGKYRRIKVELVNPATGEPLKVTDEKGRPIKYQIVAKPGYNAPRAVE